MESNIFLTGKISNSPQTVRNGDILRIGFSVTEKKTGAVIPVIADTSREIFERIKSGKTVEITGISFTRKAKINGKTKCLRTVLAQGISIS
ncbi:MAG: hypothetical protein NC120_10030 [Ruminococcus sp.]|nr:hypothetical protein [Ruminococcus sp.]